MRSIGVDSCLQGVLIAIVSVGVGASVGLWTRVSVAAAPDAGSATFAELTARAEEHRAAGEHAEAARSLAAAYDAIGEEEQGALKGEITVSNAVDDFKDAQKANPEDLALLEEEAALLERFKEHPDRQGALPAGFAEELERVRARVEDLRRAAKEAAKFEEERRTAEKTASIEKEQRAQRASVDEFERANAEQEAGARRKSNAAILGAGLVSVVGGTALTASGAWNLGNVQRRGDELSATIDVNSGGSPEEREGLRSEVEGWQERWRGIGTGMVVSGAMLTATGIGLATWGIIRTRRRNGHLDQMSVLWPTISGHGVGVSVVGRY